MDLSCEAKPASSSVSGADSTAVIARPYSSPIVCKSLLTNVRNGWGKSSGGGGVVAGCFIRPDPGGVLWKDEITTLPISGREFTLEARRTAERGIVSLMKG